MSKEAARKFKPQSRIDKDHTARAKKEKRSAATQRTKADEVVELLMRPQGATIDQLVNVTGWKTHSVRGFISGTVKQKLGYDVRSEVGDRARVYRVEARTAR